MYLLLGTDNNLAVGGLSVFFGTLTTIFPRNDIRMFRTRNVEDRLWWLYHHIGTMSGSFIAAFTAFLVQNNARLFPANLAWVGWVLPTVLGVPVIVLYIRRYKRKGASRRRIA